MRAGEREKKRENKREEGNERVRERDKERKGEERMRGTGEDLLSVYVCVPDILVFAKCREIPVSRDLDFR